MHPTEPAFERRRVRAGEQDVSERLEEVTTRLEQVERTLCALAREVADVQVAGPCTHCEGSLLVIRNNTLTCPACGYRQSL